VIALKTNSLTFRLIAAAAVWILLCLVTGGFVLSGVFRDAVESAFDDQLTFELDGLIAAAETDAPDHVTFDEGFTEPRFERIFSGWYWQIAADPPTNPQAQPVVSRSLWDQTITAANLRPGPGETMWGYAQGPERQRLRVLQRRIELPSPLEDGTRTTQPFQFLVAGDLAATEADISRFNRTLLWSFAAFSAGLLIALVIQVRVGLQPLRRVSEALARIREGGARQLEGQFPSEIAPLAGELNGLIAHSAEVVGRARSHVANLAHFLKTPLTVLANEAASQSGPLAETVTRQVTTMRRQVDHYLARARAAGALDVLGSRTEILPAVNDLVRVLSRIHAAKELVIGVEVPQGLVFRGEREDLEEMAGNLIDNACKWAHKQIVVEAGSLDGRKIFIRVSDDGPGLTPEERDRAMRRGERFDESVPGTGLGLAIVRDIAKLYGGDCLLGQSSLGGFEARLELPGGR
jgi:signal transduction histidine kinase